MSAVFSNFLPIALSPASVSDNSLMDFVTLSKIIFQTRLDAFFWYAHPTALRRCMLFSKSVIRWLGVQLFVFWQFAMKFSERALRLRQVILQLFPLFRSRRKLLQQPFLCVESGFDFLDRRPHCLDGTQHSASRYVAFLAGSDSRVAEDCGWVGPTDAASTLEPGREPSLAIIGEGGAAIAC